jgi:hypothetical protein
MREVNFTHSACAEFLADFIAAEFGAGFQGHRNRLSSLRSARFREFYPTSLALTSSASQM